MLGVSKHLTHRVLRITRSTLLDAIKVVELKELLVDNIDKIQHYKCNNDLVVYLLPRQASNGILPDLLLQYHCERCHHKLNDNKLFCSLGCMVDEKVVKDNGHDHKPTPTKTCQQENAENSTDTQHKRKQSRPERSYGPEIV